MDERKLTRRAALACLGSGAAIAVTGSFGFDSVTGARSVSLAVSDGSNALLGITNEGPVQKNQRAPMVEFTNNTSSEMTITVSLDTCSDGTLYDNQGGSGCVVTLTVASGKSQNVDIEASVTGTIPYSVSASSSDLSIDTSGSVEAEAGNIKGAVRIKKPVKDKDFTADKDENRFEVDKVDIVDNEQPDNLDKIEFRVREGGSGGTVVGSKDVDNPPVDQYNPKGQGGPAVTFDPDPSQSISSGTTYALTVTGYDADGNSSSSTIEDKP